MGTTVLPARRTIRIALPDGWARSGLAGIQAGIIGWALMMFVSMLGYLGVSENPWLGRATWEDARSVGAHAWAATLGAPIVVGDITYWAMPTVMSVLVIAGLRALLIPGRRFPAAAQWMAVPTFVLTAFGLAASTGDVRSAWVVLPGASVIGLLAVGWAVLSQIEAAPSWSSRYGWLWSGLRQAGALFLGAVTLGLGALAVSTWVNWESIGGIHQLLMASTLDGWIAWIAQSLYVFTGAAWALAWVAGPGFYVGIGALHSPEVAGVAPIPAVPLLGALPTTAPGLWVVLVPIMVGVCGGAWMSWRHRATEISGQVASGAVAVLAFGALCTTWMASAIMVLGTGRMAIVGPRTVWASALITLEIGLVAVLVALAAHPHTREWVAAKLGAVAAARTGSDAGSGAPSAHPADDSSGAATDSAAAPESAGTPRAVMDPDEELRTENLDLGGNSH